MSAWTCRHTDGKAEAPYKGLGAESEEKREPVSDIDTGVVDSLKVLDPDRPIREADIEGSKIPHCSSTRRAIPFIREARELLGSETARIHHAARYRRRVIE